MRINYYAMQIDKGWITIDDVPKKYREKVRQLLNYADSQEQED